MKQSMEESVLGLNGLSGLWAPVMDLMVKFNVYFVTKAVI